MDGSSRSSPSLAGPLNGLADRPETRLFVSTDWIRRAREVFRYGSYDEEVHGDIALVGLSLQLTMKALG